MAGREDHLLHELAAYEAALKKRERRLVEEEYKRYKNNIRATLPVDHPEPRYTDFEGCVE